jgi:hypothetical protein
VSERTYQQRHRDLLRERCERLCKLVELNAPQPILDSTAGHLIRAIVWAVGPGAFTALGQDIVAVGKESAGLCRFCPEERPLNQQWGMCDPCRASVADDEQEEVVRA